MNTTLNQIRKHSPCSEGWTKLLTALGKTKADDEALSLITILDSNGLDDALWCLRALEGRDKEIRLFAVWCARQVRHLMTDQRSINALDVAEAFANGSATEEQINAAEAAARAAAWAARAAARAAASDAASDTVGAAARDAAWAAWAAASDDASDDAWAANAAGDAAWAAEAARDAVGAGARDAAWASQEKEFRRVFK